MTMKYKYLLAGLGFASLICGSADAASSPTSFSRAGQTLDVGDFKVEGTPNFDLVADEARGVLHLIYETGAAQPHIEHRTSTDARTWSEAAMLPGEGRSPRAAVDSNGTLHVVYGRKLPEIRNDVANRVWYTSRNARAGSAFIEPVEIEAPPSHDRRAWSSSSKSKSKARMRSGSSNGSLGP